MILAIILKKIYLNRQPPCRLKRKRTIWNIKTIMLITFIEVIHHYIISLNLAGVAPLPLFHLQKEVWDFMGNFQTLEAFHGDFKMK